jgi:UPF0176 protein
VNSKNKYVVSAFYRFFALPESDLEPIQKALVKKGEELNLRGLLLLGVEGVNSTLSGYEENVNEFKSFLLKILNLNDLTFKDSWAEEHVFRRWKVKIRSEIVTIGDQSLVPKSEKNHHLSPAQWNEYLKKEDVVVLDTRNFYETEMGTFKNAIDPKISDFQQFGPFVKNSEIKKDQEILIFCTGGIRCEKAILELDQQGYKNVHQLDGGILNYLKEFPNDQYDGECFVFDHRVGLDQNLKPSQKYQLCPHCGNPGDQLIECIQCRTDEYVCQTCLAKESEIPSVKTCSKNCAYHFKKGHKSKKNHIDGSIKRSRKSLADIGTEGK